MQVWTRNKILTTSFAARICLVLYSNIHDYLFSVNFTDVDYLVYSDAAAHVANGRSPFDRATYRYTPALAYLLVPNVVLRDFGKCLFCIADILVAWLLYSIFDHRSAQVQNTKKITQDSSNISLWVVLFWLVNPLTAVVSARGNADSLVCAACLFTLLLVLKERWLLAATAFGFLAVHLKIYPIIYLPSICIYIICTESRYSLKTILWRSPLGFVQRTKVLLNKNAITFAFITIASFTAIVFGFYLIYGDMFLEEFLLYHVKRRDVRHNFSPYFYLLYLIDEDPFLSKCVGYFAFVPQICSVVFFAFRYYDDLPFCWFLTTFAFVTFNKVATSQYFVWYIVFLPLIADQIQMSIRRACVLAALWFSSQGIVLFFSYLLEFKGMNTMPLIWLSTLLFLFTNCLLMRNFMQFYTRLPYKHGSVQR